MRNEDIIKKTGDWVAEIRTHHERKNTEVTGTRIKNGGLQNIQWELREYKRKLGQPRKS